MALPNSSANKTSLIDGLDKLNPAEGAASPAAEIASKVMEEPSREQFSAKVLVSLTPTQKALLVDFANERHMTHAEVMRQALMHYVQG